MDTRSLCRLCFVVLIFHGLTESTWTLTGSSEFAVAGESFTLTCNPQDSNAVAIKWRRLDIDTTAGTSRASVDANGCTIGSGYDTQYQYTCEPGPVYKLTIPANVMTNSQNNKVWRCESVFGVGGDEYTLREVVPVSSIFIQADNAVNQQVYVIYDNIPKTFYCITNGCRPKANVTVTTTGVTKGQLTDSTTQNGDLKITRVSQVITANRGGSTTKTLQCSTVNIQGRQPITSQLVTLDVYYIPSVEPTLTGYGNGAVLYEGDKDLTLTCQQSGGYPLSVITWSCENQTGTKNNGPTVASSYVRLAVNRNLNRKTCTCSIRHPDNNLAYTRTLSVTFIVYYPPTFPTVETLGTSFPWVENTLGVLRCTTTLGNPREITYGWLLNSQVINGQTTDTYTIPRLTNVDNELHIQCRVSNLYTRNRPPAEVSNITVLDVQYAPIITLDTTCITVQEGDNTSRQCSAIGNPTPTVKWYRGSSQQTSGTGTSATLVFSNIDRNQADTYQCKATATGKQNFESSKSVSVIVYSPPDSPSEFSLAENGTRSVKVTWRRGFNGGHAQTFVIRYNKTVTQETKEITIEDTNQSSNYTVEINELEPDTTYNFWIYSKNVKGNSTLSDNLFVQTLKEPERKSQTGSIGAIVGGITGILTAIITIVVVIVGVLFYRQRTKRTTNTSDKMDGGGANDAYEDLDSRIALSDVSTYQKIRTTKIASTVYENDISMHEGLDKTQESDSNTYEAVTNEKIAEYPKEKVYVNMAIGMAD